MQKKKKMNKKSFLLEIMPLELVARISGYCNGNTCYRQSMCLKNSFKMSVRLRQTFSNSIYPEFMEKQDNSDAVLI